LTTFTTKTGIKTNVMFAAASLNGRLGDAGANSNADILLPVHAGLTG
jgi:hypothetical protein